MRFIFDKIDLYFLSAYDKEDYIVHHKAKTLLYICLALLLIAIPILMTSIVFLQSNNIEKITPIIVCCLIIAIIILLKKGSYTISAHALLIVLFSGAWISMFLNIELGNPIERLDSIVLIIGILTLTPLLILEKKVGIVFYFFINCIIFTFYVLYVEQVLLLGFRVMLEYFIDNIVTITFIGMTSYFVFVINKRALDRAKATEMEIQSQNEELLSMYEEVEAVNNELLSSREEISKSEEKYRKILESIDEGYFEINREGDIIFANDFFSHLLGYNPEENLPLTIYDFLSNESSEQFKASYNEILKTGNSEQNIIQEIKNDSNETIIAEFSLYPIIDDNSAVSGLRGMVRNITDRKKAEERMLKASKIESMGILAGGIAHDFNNILTAIVGNISLAQLNLEEGDEACELLSEAERASMRAKDLTHQLLTFSKGGNPIKKITSVKSILLDIPEFVLSGSNVKCTYEIQDDLWNADVDEGQISQVIHNLILNARQAMHKGGTIRLQAKNVILDTDNSSYLNNHNYLRIIVQDYGSGIDKLTQKKIFDPYYTTKYDGSGLGLTISYSIVHKHNGRITVNSKEGSGTTFEILLPASTREVEQNNTPKRNSINLNGKILLMDDQAMVRNVARKILENIGFEVICAQDGEEALSQFKSASETSHPFDMVIMDLTIPGKMGGSEAIKVMRSMDTDIFIIASSGYSNDPVMANYKNYGFDGVITKPYNFDDMKETIEKLIKI